MSVKKHKIRPIDEFWKCSRCGMVGNTDNGAHPCEPQYQGDLSPFRHGEEGTHHACQTRIKKEGGKLRCCSCVPHKGCEFDPRKIEMKGKDELLQMVILMPGQEISQVPWGGGKNYLPYPIRITVEKMYEPEERRKTKKK